MCSLSFHDRPRPDRDEVHDALEAANWMRRSAPITWDQVRVGLVLIVALVILGFGVFFIGNIGDVFGTRYSLLTLMESAAGLVPGAPVQVAGQNVGQVDRVEFIRPDERPSGGQAVAVWLGINVSIQDQIRADSRARVRTQGLLGDRLIDIEPGSADQRVLGDGDTLSAAPAISYEELLGQAADAIQSLTGLSNDLTATLRGVSAGEGSLGQLLVDDELYAGLVELNRNLNGVLGPMLAGEGALGQLLGDERLYDRIVSATARLDSVTALIVEGEGTIGQLVRSDSLYLALTSSAGRADSLFAAIQRGDGSIGRMLTDERLYEELLRTVVDLNTLLQDVRANPRKFIPTIKVF
jgi:phospholipid/cholesterol/gamma-HCH transport system substrate-binding protein